MAQINLLKQENNSSKLWNLPGILAKILLLGLLLIVGYYAWLFISEKTLVKKTVSLEKQIQEAKIAGLEYKDRDIIFTRQTQLQELEKILTSHAYFSKIFSAISKVTLKSAVYTNLQANANGEVSLSVIVPSVSELDKFLQVFDAPKFNQNFSSVRVSSWAKVRTEDGINYKFEVKMQFNPEILKF